MTKTIVITGSTSGIGKELVNLFAKDCRVFAGCRNESLIVPADNVEYFYIDMTDRNSIVQAANFIKAGTNKIDVLINAAGCVVAGAVEHLDTDRLRYQFDVNTFSHLEFTQNLLDLLDGGRIVNISSMASFGHFPFISPYCASKRALDIFFNALQLETHRNIKVISVKPGVIATPIWEKSVKSNLESLESCRGYETEMEFLKNNALKSAQKGLPVEKAAKFIKKVSEVKNPHSSYTLGNDARFAQILSLFPQNLINRIIKFGMKIRMSK